MKIYLLGLTVVTPKRQFVARGFGKTNGFSVDVETIQRWESEVAQDYRERFPGCTVKVFSFQELG